MYYSIIGNGHNTKQIECDYGYQIVALLLKSKCHLINIGCVDLLFLLGGVDRQNIQSSVVSNSGVFKCILLDLEIWKHADPNLLYDIMNTLRRLMTQECRQRIYNKHRFRRVHLLQRLTFMLRDETILDSTLEEIVLIMQSFIEENEATEKDIERFARFMISTLHLDDDIGDTGVNYVEGKYLFFVFCFLAHFLALC